MKIHDPPAQSGGVGAVTRKTPGSPTSSLTSRTPPDMRQVSAGSSVEKPLITPAGTPSPLSGREARATAVSETGDWSQTPE